MTKEETISRISRTGVLPVVRAGSADAAHRAIEAVCKGGIDTIEVTLTVPNAVDLLAKLVREMPNVLFGAGTVMSADDAQRCIDAGATFIISPATIPEIIRVCIANKTLVMPGVLTPTEIATALSVGAEVVKVFPVGAVGGADYIRSLRAPFPDLKVVPTGGINIDTASDHIRAGAMAVGVGSDLVDLKAIEQGRASEVTERARRVLDAIAETRK